MYRKLPPTVSFDFDHTLTHSDVQEYAAELIKAGVNVWVITARFDDLHGHLWAPNANNDGLWKITDSLGIPRDRVRFCNGQPKADFLARTRVLWHLDDDIIELENLKYDQDVTATGILVKSLSWKDNCQKILDEYFKTEIFDKFFGY
jgi:hypothetical protein